MLTVPDTNICLQYLINHKVKKANKIIHIRLNKKSSNIDRYVEPKISENTIRVTETINRETINKIWDILCKMGSKHSFQASTIQKLIRDSMLKFDRLTQKQIYPDNLSLLSEVKHMYAVIWNDPTKKREKNLWATKKHMNVADGPPGGPDLHILSTTATLEKYNIVELLTLDNDFILFANEILYHFSVSIKDGKSI